MTTQALAMGSLFFFPGFDDKAFFLIVGMLGSFFFSGPKIDDAFVRRMEQTYPASTMDPVLVISDKFLDLEYAQFAEYGDMAWTDSNPRYAMIILDHKLNPTRPLRTWMLTAIFGHLRDGGKLVVTDNLEVIMVITK